MSSTLRAGSSRANGARSRGPVTPEGRRATAEAATGPVTPEGEAIVSRNAVRHGLLSQSVVLPSESVLAFEEILEGLRAELRPGTTIEHQQIEVMANGAPSDAASDTIAASYLPPGPSPAPVEQVEEPVEELYDA